MERTTHNRLSLIALVTALLLTASAIGDGISGSGYVNGRVAQFRSIVVNGVHYNTDNAIVYVNGELAELSEIMLGQQVLALVDYETLEAIEIHQYDTVTGQIDESDIWDETLAQLRLKVLGQDVLVDLETVFHIEVSELDEKKKKYITIGGLRDEDGIIRATSIEKAEDKKDLLVTGFVEDLDDDGFEIGDAKITSDYLAEFVAAGWLYEGAAVQARGKHYKKGVLHATSIIPVPTNVVVLGYPRGFADIRIDGSIDSYDPATGMLCVNDIELQLSHKAVMHDLRDFVRWFGIQDVFPGDAVSLAAERVGEQLTVRKLVRFDKVKQIVRAPLTAHDAHEGSLTVLSTTVHLDAANKIHFAGEKVKDDDLMSILQADDAIELEWKKDAKLERLAAVPNCGEQHDWDNYLAEQQLNEDQRKKKKKDRDKLKKNDPRAYACYEVQ